MTTVPTGEPGTPTSLPDGGSRAAGAGDTAPGVGFTAALAVATVGAAMANLVPLVLTLPLKATEIDPAGATGVLSTAVAVGSVASLVSFPALGRLSDRTAGRFGRRRPFLLLGALLIALGAVGVTLAGSTLTLTLAGVATAVGFSATMVACTAAIPDRVPADRRGPASAIVGLSLPVGAVVGLFIAQLLAPDLTAMLLVPAAVGAVGSLLFAAVLRDTPVPSADRVPSRGRAFLGTFWVSPRRHPDFAWAWASRFLLFLGVAAVQAYQAFYLIAELGYTPATVAGAVFLSTLVLTVCALLFAPLAGRLSDRIARRKPFVIGSALVFGVGLALAAFASSFPTFLVAMAVIGLGQGVYFAVDIALVTLVLPDPANPAKDLGIMNLANTLPAALVPALAPIVLTVAATTQNPQNFTALFGLGAVAGLLGAVLVLPIRGAR